MSDAIPRDVPFSLSCTECDCDSPETYEDAVSDGWTQIEYFPEGSSENFLGLCPDCRRQEEANREKLREAFESQEQDSQGGGPCPT